MHTLIMEKDFLFRMIYTKISMQKKIIVLISKTERSDILLIIIKTRDIINLQLLKIMM